MVKSRLMICRNCKVEVDDAEHSNVECIAYLRAKLERVAEILRYDVLPNSSYEGWHRHAEKALAEIENSIPVGL